MPATIAPAFGNDPSTIMITAAAATTQRLRTCVMRTSPTFSAKQVYGNEFSTPPIVVARPSARIARAMSSRLIGMPTISPVAYTSPVVSTMVMTMTHAHRDDGHQAEGGHAEVERCGVAHPGRRGHCTELRITHCPRHQRADHEAEQHGDGAEKAAGYTLYRHDQEQRPQRIGEVVAEHGILDGIRPQPPRPRRSPPPATARCR